MKQNSPLARAEIRRSKPRSLTLFKSANCLPALITSLLLALGLCCQAQSWQTVDDFQLDPNYANRGGAITVDGSDTVFAVGVSKDESSGIPSYAVVRRIQDHGVTWETVDTSSEWHTVKAVAVSTNGAVAFVGSARDSLNSYWWRVRVSPDGGVNWFTVYDPRESADYDYGEAVSASFGPDGALYVAGWDFQNWIVRRSSDLGATWSAVAKIPRSDRLAAMRFTPSGIVLSSGEPTGGSWQVLRSTNQFASWTLLDDWVTEFGDTTRGMTEDKLGNLVVVGGVMAGDPRPFNWVVRRSTNDGATWTTTDQLRFPLINGIQYGEGAMGVVTDSAGRIWVAGSDQAGIRTRVSYDDGLTWTNSDSFRYDGLPTLSARSQDITSDSLGNVFVIGWVNPWLPEHPRWIVRRLQAGLPPPSVSTSLSGNALSLTWPVYPTGFVLQSATTLANGGDWQDTNLTPTESNGQKVATVTPTGPRGFFRLRGP